MDFEREFVDWLSNCMSEDIPESVKGFSFNLFEPAGKPNVKFGIELIGSSYFDNVDPDWPCDEIWEPKQRYLFIPVEYSGKEWKECLEKMKELVTKHLDGNLQSSRKLKTVEGVGLGFVDGDLSILWKA